MLGAKMVADLLKDIVPPEIWTQIQESLTKSNERQARMLEVEEQMLKVLVEIRDLLAPRKILPVARDLRT